jgi:hypothetical protein
MPGRNDPRPEVRGEFLRWLATDAEAAPQIDLKGIRVYSSTISNSLDLENCSLQRKLAIFCSDCKDRVLLREATTKGVFVYYSSLLGGLDADGTIFHGSFRLNVIESSDKINLMDAKIYGNLDCRGATLAFDGDALMGDRARIEGGIFLNVDPISKKRFTCNGTIRFLGAEINGNLVCSSAQLSCTREALCIDGAKIGGYVFFDREPEFEEDFECDGEIRLVGAEIAGDIFFYGAKVNQVSAWNLRVNGDLFWLGVRNSERANLILTGSRVKNLHDDVESLPRPGRLNLNDFSYENLVLHAPPAKHDFASGNRPRELGTPVKDRIEWLTLQDAVRRLEPQPWMQLAKLLESKGDRKGAKHVIYNFRCLRADKKSYFPRRWAIFFAWLEEAPLRILWTLTATVALGTLIFAGGTRSGAMIETVRLQPNFASHSRISAHYPTFQPFIYSLENGLPLVKLGMDDRWIPDPRHVPQPWFPKHPWLDGLKWLNSYWLLAISRWLLILSGWVQATILIAAVSDRFKK